ncbi:uncharacterized protein LOC143499707 [Brachyhypopomus gauderio]|uniref:uncharacterized protein LOC143499707 n=1 Tax=Brachyhypopomus gauderio TaxID=698409 RepID=UPI004041E6B6
MGNRQSQQEQQKKGLVRWKDTEKRTEKGRDPQTPAERGNTKPTIAKKLTPAQDSPGPELLQQLKHTPEFLQQLKLRGPELPQQLKCRPELPQQLKHTPTFSVGVGESLLCPLQPVISTNPLQSSACPVVKNTAVPWSEHTASLNSKIQNTHIEQQWNSPSRIHCDASGGSSMAATPFPQYSVPVSPPELPALVTQRLLNAAAEHVSHSSTSPSHPKTEGSAVSNEASPPPLLPGTLQLLEKTDHTLKVTNRPVATTGTFHALSTPELQPKTKAASDTTATKLKTTTRFTCDKESLSEGAPLSEIPANVEQLPFNLLAEIDSRIEYVKKQEVLPKPQMQAAVRRALTGVSYQEAVKGTSPKVNPAHHEGKRKQVMKKVRMSRLTNKKPPQSGRAQSAVPTPVHGGRNFNRGVSDTLSHSPSMSSEGSFEATSNMPAKTEEILHTSNDMERNKDVQMMVQTEVSGGADKQIPPITRTAHTNNNLDTELSKKVDYVYVFGQSNQKHFSQSFNYVFAPEFKEGPVAVLNQVTQFSTPQPRPSFAAFPNNYSSLEPSHMQSTTPTSTASEETPDDLKAFTDCTPTSETACVEQSPEVGHYISKDPPTAAKRNHMGIMEEDTSAQTETIWEATTEEAPPPHASPLHPEGRWHPFSTDRVCPRRAWCVHRGLPMLPPNVRRWFDVKQNYLCEPPWVTTATLAASLALSMRQKNTDLCLWK